MNAEIVTSGTELLLGETVDTNSTYIARQLRDVGVNLFYKTSVGDNVERMALVLRHALERSDLVITTGGLGPTVDDVTRDAVALVTGRPLAMRPECLEQIEAIFARWGRPVGENNRKQAYLPEGALPILNPVGTAPGFIVEVGDKAIISLPGVPREMQHLMQSAVLPYLRGRLGAEQVVIKAKVLRTAALGESWIDERIDSLMRSANPTVGLAAHSGIVDVRITARAGDEASADTMIAEFEGRIRELLGPYGVYGTGEEKIEDVAAAALRSAGVRLALVESATAGEVARRLASAPDGSGLITAAHSVAGAGELCELLGLSPALLDSFGWVSQMAATQAGYALCDTYEGWWGVAVLGDMTAADDVYGQQVGETWAAVATPSSTEVRHYPYGGRGALAPGWVTLRVLDLLRRLALQRIAEREAPCA